jgi:hypothetical protein
VKYGYQINSNLISEREWGFFRRFMEGEGGRKFIGKPRRRRKRNEGRDVIKV